MKKAKTFSLPFTSFFNLKTASLFVVLFFHALVANSQSLPSANIIEKQIVTLDINQLTGLLKQAPMESTAAATTKPGQLNLPMPDGSLRLFRVVESPIMAPDFAALYPTFKTYAVQAADDPSVTGRISITPYGFNGVVLAHEGMVMIRPLDLLNPVQHEVSLNHLSAKGFICDAVGGVAEIIDNNMAENMTVSNGATKRTYTLAIVGTGEFYAANGGTTPAASAVVVSSVNGIQAIYERELAVNFTLLTPFIYTNPATDPFNPGLDRVLQAAQAVEANFPGGNYDMGHVFHDQDQGAAELGSGGVAGLGVVCANWALGTGFGKAGGWSSSFDNVSAGWIGLAAHEFGHMFDMPHTFNGTGSNCTSNISASNSYEIASGNSLMSYNGICGAGQNIPDGGTADDYFHANSLEKAVNYMNSVNCHDGTPTGNMPPVVNANPCGGAYTIPKSTPFRLTGSGTDANGDQIYYSWEQYDEDGAGVTPTQGFIGATAAASSIAPLFRSYPPTTSPTRTFPIMSLVAANNYAADFEPLPSVARTLNFRLTGRDWRVGGGGIHCSPLAVTVSASGPFSVTAPNGGETIAAGGNTTVTWDMNGTNAFCTNVNIKLSVDGGLTFPYTLLANTPNDGSQSVTLPAGVANSTAARVMVECADNLCVVFFDISNANFTVTSSCNSAFSNICPTGTMTLPTGDPGLNLGLSNYYGSAISQNTFSITAGSPTGPLANATVQGGTTCQTAWGSEKYATLDFAVSSGGSYTITNPGGGQIMFSVFTAAGYNPAMPCAGTFLGSNAWDAIAWGSSATVTLTACTAYKVVVWTLSGANATPTLTFSGTGSVYSSLAGPGAGYSYTYAAVNTTNSQVVAVSATSNFSSLGAGSYNIYGASYYSGAGPNPPTVNPATWVGQTITQILSGGSCVLFSTNFKPLTVTGGGGCTPPTVNAPTVTQPNCANPTGTIVVNATGGGTLEYSVNNGLTWQASNTFSGLAVGSYTLVVRLQSNPTCMTNYGANPVVLNPPAPAVTAPTVTQPTCAVPTGTIVVNATGGGTLEYSVNNGTTWQASATFAGLAAGNYTIKVRLQADPTCMTAYAMNPVVLVAVSNDPCICNTYCTVSATTAGCTGDEFISNVTFATINNTSVCGDDMDGYTDYTGISTTVSTGTSYTLNVTNGGPFTDDQCKAWFDWNANGVFTDAGEEFTLTGSGTNNAQNWTVSVPVPGGATLGSTRMRVRVTWNTGMAPCGVASYGETEDYCITINSAGCTPPVVTAPTVTQPTCAVPTGTIVVNATGGGTLEYSVNDGTTWQASNTFSSLAAGSYTIKVRLQANPTCMASYGMNPVVL
ncbi:MAG: hypothetical protein KDD27_15175, partial [Saprospiraceae bacterium]|nr:hypothetical protein [Saprospiraceae bacterium]